MTGAVFAALWIISGAISWSIKLQKCVTTSAEAELNEFNFVEVFTVLWLRVKVR